MDVRRRIILFRFVGWCSRNGVFDRRSRGGVFKGAAGAAAAEGSVRSGLVGWREGESMAGRSVDWFSRTGVVERDLGALLFELPKKS